MNFYFHSTGQSFDTAKIFEREDVSSDDIVELSDELPYLSINDVSEVEQLQSNVLNSLNYASSQNVLPSTLPGQLNVKFLNTSTFDKLRDRITPSQIAQLEDPNTLYVSTKLLPQYQQNSNDHFISKLYDKFKNPQQVLDLIVFHELGHLVFNNSFSDFLKFNKELLNNKSMLEKFRDKFFKENHESVPLYQINRSLEEHFADSYSSIILSKRYGATPTDYIDIRNGNDTVGLTRTKGFDININRLDNSFKQLSLIDYEKDGIDTVIKQLYEISLKGSKEILSSHLKLVRDDNLLNKLQSNLKTLGISTENNKKDILDKAEEIIKSKAENGEPKIVPNKRMFLMPNVEEKLKFLDSKFSKVDSLSENNRLKR